MGRTIKSAGEIQADHIGQPSTLLMFGRKVIQISQQNFGASSTLISELILGRAAPQR